MVDTSLGDKYTFSSKTWDLQISTVVSTFVSHFVVKPLTETMALPKDM